MFSVPLQSNGLLIGADNRNRTDNLLITSQLLYLLSHISIYASIQENLAFCLFYYLPLQYLLDRK